jgi:hypothetical protein
VCKLSGKAIASAALITDLFAIERSIEGIDDAIRQTPLISRPAEERGDIVDVFFKDRMK